MSCKYDNLAWSLFQKLFYELTLDEQIDIIDIWYERNE